MDLCTRELNENNFAFLFGNGAQLKRNCLGIILSSGMTVSDLKHRVAEKTGVPTARHRYYNVSKDTCNACRFADTNEILRGDGDKYAIATLAELQKRGRIKQWGDIGVVFLPAETDAAAGGDGDEDGYVEVAREESDAVNDDPATATVAEANDVDATDDMERNAGQLGVGAAEDDGGAEDVAAAAFHEAAVNANGAEEEATPAAEEEGGAPQSLRQWLQSLEVDGTPAGRFERYADAFEFEFGSLRDLALAADNPRLGMSRILRACNVQRMGDKAAVEWAIGKIPRPE